MNTNFTKAIHRTLMALLAVALFAVPSMAAEKYAILVGINEYQEDAELSRLNFAINDVHALAQSLEKVGYDADHIHVLTSDADDSTQPTKTNLIRTLQKVIQQVGSQSDASLMVVFSGHGFNSGADSFLCPVDYRAEAPESSSVCVTDLSQMLARSPFSQKLVVLDACRNNSDEPSDEFNLVTGLNRLSVHDATSPQGVVFLSSCLPGQRSWEVAGEEVPGGEHQPGHGVFMKFFIEGVEGAADHAGNFDGSVTTSELAQFVSVHTREYVKDHLSEIQVPWHDSHSTSDMTVGQLSTEQMNAQQAKRGQIIRKSPLDLANELAAADNLEKAFIGLTMRNYPVTINATTQAISYVDDHRIARLMRASVYMMMGNENPKEPASLYQKALDDMKALDRCLKVPVTRPTKVLSDNGSRYTGSVQSGELLLVTNLVQSRGKHYVSFNRVINAEGQSRDVAGRIELNLLARSEANEAAIQNLGSEITGSSRPQFQNGQGINGVKVAEDILSRFSETSPAVPYIQMVDDLARAKQQGKLKQELARQAIRRFGF
jgi:hypothetical protein